MRHVGVTGDANKRQWRQAVGDQPHGEAHGLVLIYGSYKAEIILNMFLLILSDKIPVWKQGQGAVA